MAKDTTIQPPAEDAFDTLMQQFGGQRSPAAVGDATKKDELQTTTEKPVISGDSSVLVEIPISPAMPPSEFTVHVDIKLTPPQSTALRRVAAELDRKQARLLNGQRVINVNGAIRWLIEQIQT